MKSVGNDRKYALSFPIIFLLANDTKTICLKMIPKTKNRYIGNETIGSKICWYRSITVPQIENTETMNGHICNMFTTKWVTNSPTWILLHICPYYNHLWLTTTKFCSQQVFVTAANLPTRLLTMVASASWRLRVETEVIYVGLCYLTIWVSVLPKAYGTSDGNSEFRQNFPRKTVDTCIRRNKDIIISTNIFLFPYHFRLILFPFYCFSYFSETKLGRSGIYVTFDPYMSPSRIGIWVALLPADSKLYNYNHTIPRLPNGLIDRQLTLSELPFHSRNSAAQCKAVLNKL
jgi:hypothetical protein